MTRQIQQQVRRQAMLEVAGRHFLEHGYGATTMSAIAAAIGGSKETLWRHFPSKEALFTAYIEQATETFRGRLAAELTTDISLEETLLRFTRHYIEEICSPESMGLHRLAVSESARFPEIGRLFYERAPKATEELLSQFLEKQMQGGNLRIGDAGRAARVLIQFCLMIRYPILFGVQLVTDLDTAGLARHSVDDFMAIYSPPVSTKG